MIQSALKIVNSLSQDNVSTAEGVSEHKTTPEMSALLRRAAAEGAVLLKMKARFLWRREQKLLFWPCTKQLVLYRIRIGGDVNKPYQVGLMDGLKACGKLHIDEELATTYQRWCTANPPDDGFWGHWPRFYPEMPVTDTLVSRAASRCDTAIVAIGRSSGEDRENALERGAIT